MIFGTDGVRGRYPDEIDEELVGRLAAGFSAFLPAGHLMLGQDTRQSGGSLAAAAAGAAAAGGRRVLDLGVAPTPMVSFAIRHTGAAGGIVISASHNPPNHNGIKLFSAQGAKLTAADEVAVERAMPPAAPVSGEGEPLDLLDDYTSSLAAASGPPSGTWVLDPAHGALAALATRVFERLGHRVVAINDEPCGDAINVGCGVLDLAPLRAAVAACPDALGGFAFDGDGDRCLALTKSGDLLDGDDLLVDWCRQARQEGEPVGTVVGTVLSNGGLEDALAAHGTVLQRVAVGDREVAQAIAGADAGAGGEPSGHTIFPHLGPTGDGLASALVWTSLAPPTGLGPPAGRWPRQTQAALTIPLDRRGRTRWEKEGRLRLEGYLRALPDGARAVVRPSGTESILRVMVEHPSPAVAKEGLSLLARNIGAWL